MDREFESLYLDKITSSSSVGRTLHLGCRGRQFESGLFDNLKCVDQGTKDKPFHNKNEDRLP